MTEPEEFEAQRKVEIEHMGADPVLRDLSRRWMDRSWDDRYSYHFNWLGRPIIQYPQDIVALQEIIWSVQPELIVETGIARGGSLIFHASMLELIGGDGLVLGIDIDIRAHNRVEIERHPFFRRIRMIEGSSIDDAVAEQVRQMAAGKKRVLVILDSNHVCEHVRKELQLYSPLVQRGSYLIVFDTLIEELPEEMLKRHGRWRHGDNPMTAVQEFLRHNDRFVVDREIENKLQITVAPGGYLKCVKD